MVVAEESAGCAEWRRMSRRQYQMARLVNQLTLAPGVCSPEDENESGTLAAQFPDGRICELFPAFALVRSGFMGADGKCGVEQQDSLTSPACQIAVSRDRGAGVVVDLLEDIDKRPRYG